MTDRTELAHQWLIDTDFVTVTELMSFCDYSAMPVCEAIQRLRKNGVELLPEIESQ